MAARSERRLAAGAAWLARALGGCVVGAWLWVVHLAMLDLSVTIWSVTNGMRALVELGWCGVVRGGSSGGICRAARLRCERLYDW